MHSYSEAERVERSGPWNSLYNSKNKCNCFFKRPFGRALKEPDIENGNYPFIGLKPTVSWVLEIDIDRCT